MSNSAFTPTTTQVTTEVPVNVPVVGAWQSYNLTIGATITAPTPGTILINEARWRRVGDSMEIYYSLRTSTAGTVGSGIYLFPLPSGYTADSSKMSPAGLGSSGAISIVGPAEVERSSIIYAGAAFLYNSTNIAIQVGATGQAITLIGPLYTLDLPSKYTFRAVVPIAEWAGSGTTTLADRALEEYAWNSDTSAASNSSAFGYGLSGVNFIGSTPAGNNIDKRVRFTTPILSTDSIIFEINTGDLWRPLTVETLSTDSRPISVFTTHSNNQYGAGRIKQVNSTDVDVTFARYRSTGTTYDGTTGVGLWGDITSGGAKWRLRKVSSGAQVGYPISTRNIVGDTSGTTVPTGMLGETYRVPVSGSAPNLTTVNLATISIPAGVWSVTFCGYFNVNNAILHQQQISLSLTSATTDSNFISILQGNTATAEKQVSLTRIVNTIGQNLFLTWFQNGGASTAINGYIVYTRIA